MGGGGPRCLSSGVSTSQARRRHEAQHLSLCWGGGFRVAPVVAFPTLRSHPRWSPRWGLHGACSLRARSCGPSRTLSPLPSHPAALSSGGGGGGGAFRPPLPSSPTLGGAEVCGGGGRPCLLPFVARMSQARRKHGAGTRRGTCPSARGGGLPCGSRRRPSYPASPPPVVPPLGLARRVLPTGTVVWSVPHPLSAASPPCRFVLGGGGGGGALSAPPYLHPPPLGGRRCVGGGGAPLSSSLRSTHVAGTTQARRRHEARHLSLCRGGGGACRVAPVVALPTLCSHPWWSPRWGLHSACSLRARSCGPSRTLSPPPPHPAASCSGGGGGGVGGAFRPPLPSSPTLGGAEVCGGGRGALVVFPS